MCTERKWIGVAPLVCDCNDYGHTVSIIVPIGPLVHVGYLASTFAYINVASKSDCIDNHD